MPAADAPRRTATGAGGRVSPRAAGFRHVHTAVPTGGGPLTSLSRCDAPRAVATGRGALSHYSTGICRLHPQEGGPSTSIRELPRGCERIARSAGSHNTIYGRPSTGHSRRVRERMHAPRRALGYARVVSADVVALGARCDLVPTGADDATPAGASVRWG